MHSTMIGVSVCLYERRVSLNSEGVNSNMQTLEHVFIIILSKCFRPEIENLDYVGGMGLCRVEYYSTQIHLTKNCMHEFGVWY